MKNIVPADIVVIDGDRYVVIAIEGSYDTRNGWPPARRITLQYSPKLENGRIARAPAVTHAAMLETVAPPPVALRPQPDHALDCRPGRIHLGDPPPGAAYDSPPAAPTAAAGSPARDGA